MWADLEGELLGVLVYGSFCLRAGTLVFNAPYVPPSVGWFIGPWPSWLWRDWHGGSVFFGVFVFFCLRRAQGTLG